MFGGCAMLTQSIRWPDHQGNPHIRESRISAPVRPRMQAAGLQCLKLQIAVAFPDPQTRAFRGTQVSRKTRSPNNLYNHSTILAFLLYFHRFSVNLQELNVSLTFILKTWSLFSLRSSKLARTSEEDGKLKGSRNGHIDNETAIALRQAAQPPKLLSLLLLFVLSLWEAPFCQQVA